MLNLKMIVRIMKISRTYLCLTVDDPVWYHDCPFESYLTIEAAIDDKNKQKTLTSA